MISERHVILLNKKIDGCLDAAERSEIETALATDADVRDLYRRMVGVGEMLGTLEPVDPPADLASNVLSAIAHPCLPRPRRIGVFERLRNLARSKARLRYAVSFAAGVAAGVAMLVFANFNTTTVPVPDPADITGTIAGIDRGVPPHTLTEQRFQHEDVKGTIRLVEITPRAWSIQLQITSEHALTAQLRYNQSAINFRGIQYAGDMSSRFETEPGVVQVIHQGVHDYAFVFTGDPQSEIVIDLRVLRGGLLFEKQIKSLSNRD